MSWIKRTARFTKVCDTCKGIIYGKDEYYTQSILFENKRNKNIKTYNKCIKCYNKTKVNIVS